MGAARGLVTYQVSYPVIIVRARILSIGKDYEEAAMDLGAPPRAVIRRILLPLLYPAIFARFAIAFADSSTSLRSGTSRARQQWTVIGQDLHGSPTPAVNAAVTFLLVTTTVAIVLGYFLYRRATRGQRTAGVFEFANV